MMSHLISTAMIMNKVMAYVLMSFTFFLNLVSMDSNCVYIYQGCTKGQKSWGAGSNAARRRCPAAPSDLPKSGGAAAPPAPPLGASLTVKTAYFAIAVKKE